MKNIECSSLNIHVTASKAKKGGTFSTQQFSWAFLLLMWNAMSRSDSIEDLRMEHITWNNDSLTIEEQGHKADKAGKDKFAKHVYANPLNPVICPILALGVMILSSSDRLNSNETRLFLGTLD